MAVELILPAAFDARPTEQQSRWLVAVQHKMIVAHNEEAARLPLSKFRVRQRGFWRERIGALGACLADHRTRHDLWGCTDEHGEDVLPLNRTKVAASLSPAELAAIDLSATFRAEPGPVEEPTDPTEDYTDYTEHDPASDLTVSANNIHADTAANVDYWLYRDMGSGHFDSFSHLVDFRLVSGESSSSALKAVPWSLSNVNSDDAYDWLIDNEQAVFISGRAKSGRWHLYNCESGLYDSYDGLTLNQWYYLLMYRPSGAGASNLYGYIYSNSARSVLVDVLLVAVNSSRTWQYAYGTVSWNTGYAHAYVFDAANLDFQEAASAAVCEVLGGGVLV